jgi:hypothetical protein
LARDLPTIRQSRSSLRRTVRLPLTKAERHSTDRLRGIRIGAATVHGLGG